LVKTKVYVKDKVTQCMYKFVSVVLTADCISINISIHSWHSSASWESQLGFNSNNNSFLSPAILKSPGTNVTDAFKKCCATDL